MAVTAFISRLKRAQQQSTEPTDQDLGMDLGMGGMQQPLTAPNFTSPTTTSTFSGVGNRYLESPELALGYLKSIYRPLKRHYDWFRRMQRGQIKQYSRVARSRTEAYRWRGRTEKHVLTSGMDDYPRGPPHAGELHLDLISWMGFFTRTMKEIAGFVGEKEDEESFQSIEDAILNNIEGGILDIGMFGLTPCLITDLHWSNEHQMYCDANVDNNGLYAPHTLPFQLIASLCAEESYHVCHKGYLSLFPFMLSLLPPSSPHLGPILDLLRDPKHLWSPYGIRSLSLSHPEFGQGENYWKGPIWVQMNYLVLAALHKVGGIDEHGVGENGLA